MNKPAWMQELVMLCERFAYLDMFPDLVATNQADYLDKVEAGAEVIPFAGKRA